MSERERERERIFFGLIDLIEEKEGKAFKAKQAKHYPQTSSANPIKTVQHKQKFIPFSLSKIKLIIKKKSYTHHSHNSLNFCSQDFSLSTHHQWNPLSISHQWPSWTKPKILLSNKFLIQSEKNCLNFSSFSLSQLP